MIQDFKTLDEFEAGMPEAYAAIMAQYKEDVEEEFDGEMEDLVDYVREAWDYDEEADSDYITCNYKLTVGHFRFEVSGQSYRKDGSVCEEEMLEGITVTDLVAKKKSKKEKKEGDAQKNREDWNVFLLEADMKDILDVLQNIKFPKQK